MGKKIAQVYVIDTGALLHQGTAWELVQRHVTSQLAAVHDKGAASLVSIVLCGTRHTHNHLLVDEDEHEHEDSLSSPSLHEFAHLTELSYGLTKVSVSLARDWTAQARGLQDNPPPPPPLPLPDSSCAGTLTDGIRLAVRMLQATTAGKQYQRSIVVYADPEQPRPYRMPVPPQELVQDLQALECAVQTIIFQTSLVQPTLQDGKDGVSDIGVAIKQEEAQVDTAAAADADTTADTPTPVKSTFKQDSHNDDDSVTDDEADYSMGTSNNKTSPINHKRIKTEQVNSMPEPILPVSSFSTHNGGNSINTSEERVQFLQSLVNQTTQGTYTVVQTVSDLFPFCHDIHTANLKPFRKE